LPADCGIAEIEQVFGQFLAAINARDQAGVLARIAPTRELNWFGVVRQGGGYLRLQRPLAVVQYFDRRVREGERLTLRKAEISPVASPGSTGPWARPAQGTGRDDPIVAASFLLTVEDSDRGERKVRPGKAGIDCRTKQFYVWNGG
jgi:hypothetical protein